VEISAKQLRAMARHVDELHHDAMRTFREETGEVHLASSDAGRRTFLTKAAVSGAVVAAGSLLTPAAAFASTSSRQALTDGDIAVFAQSVELAAVAAYGMAAGVLSADVKPVAELFAKHHQDHADAFGALAGAGATNKPNAKLVTALTPTLQGIKDQTAALSFAFQLENQAAETYAFALTALQSIEAAKGTATILPIESAHAGVLGFALGKELEAEYPTGAFITAQVGDGSDITKGIDPAVYPVG